MTIRVLLVEDQRVFREALTNIAKHAHASAVAVKLTRSRGVLTGAKPASRASP